MRFLDFLTGKRRPNPNLDPNDPCWCGSAKKYKNCHLSRDERKRSRMRALTCKSSG